ncbi:hypothetical protein KP509_22G074300 [Ceratopteris richardii]|uniref:BHLH domain-containing protein n=1 Tax=Ceratopteris richardii TaxID=49495 RepID=A0A8T2S947_CERRI|nr:hypothetical protein KP509_22G074300 [Ceratopteris richardii]
MQEAEAFFVMNSSTVPAVEMANILPSFLSQVFPSSSLTHVPSSLMSAGRQLDDLRSFHISSFCNFFEAGYCLTENARHREQATKEGGDEEASREGDAPPEVKLIGGNAHAVDRCLSHASSAQIPFSLKNECPYSLPSCRTDLHITSQVSGCFAAPTAANPLTLTDNGPFKLSAQPQPHPPCWSSYNPITDSQSTPVLQKQEQLQSSIAIGPSACAVHKRSKPLYIDPILTLERGSLAAASDIATQTDTSCASLSAWDGLHQQHPTASYITPDNGNAAAYVGNNGIYNHQEDTKRPIVEDRSPSISVGGIAHHLQSQYSLTSCDTLIALSSLASPPSSVAMSFYTKSRRTSSTAAPTPTFDHQSNNHFTLCESSSGRLMLGSVQPSPTSQYPAATSSCCRLRESAESATEISCSSPVHSNQNASPKAEHKKLSVHPQGVAARRRRHRISRRFKALRAIVPGGTKMDTASMLDEAIEYIKFLRNQIWMLKLLEMEQGINTALPNSMPVAPFRDHPESARNQTYSHRIFSPTFNA